MPKKSKSIKQGDAKQAKAWEKKKNASGYLIEKVTPNKTVLIVCEGQTEELYFKSFPVITLTVSAMGIGQSKLKLVETAGKLAKKGRYDEVWCVFDMDIKLDEADSKPDFDNAIAKAVRNGHEVAYSNDAFKLWFYLHYQDTDAEHHRTVYYDKLGKLWDINYEKEGKKQSFSKGIYVRLLNEPKSSQTLAISRAEKMYKKLSHLPFHQQNPVTTGEALKRKP